MLESPSVDDIFRLKGRLFTLTVLELRQCHLSNFKQALEKIYHQAPNMFSSTPVVLDLKALKGASFDLKGFAEAMKAVHMVPVAVQHASVIQQKAAVACGLSVLSSKDIGQQLAKTEEVVIEEDVKSTAEQPMEEVEFQQSPRPSKVITSPVRSGQQVYAKGADLIILAAVGPGAEVLADGHIHVYGPLRGRALAGIKGDKSARIFCSKLEAELVSIAGHYLMLEPELHHEGDKAKQILLQEERLQISDL